MNIADLKVGDKVGYNCIPSLMTYRGVVVEVARTPVGGDCRVIWNTGTVVRSAECASNLRAIT